MSMFDYSTTASDVVAAFPMQVAEKACELSLPPLFRFLTTKTVVITGTSTGGLGATVALALASARPSTIVLLGRTESKVSPVIEEISKISPTTKAHFVEIDLLSLSSVRTAAASVAALVPKIDVLLNNAGIMGEHAPTAESTLENWRKVLAVNLDGVYFGMKYGIAAMLDQGSGVVLNMASIVGLVAFGKNPPYSASKAAVIQLTRAAAIEYADRRIRVNALCPTVVQTPLLENFIRSSSDPEDRRQRIENLNPMPGMPTPEDIAAAALFLASDEAAFITGVALPIDGGYTAR